MRREARVSRREKTLGLLSASCQIRTKKDELCSSGGFGEVERVRRSRDRILFGLSVSRKFSPTDFVFETTEVKLAYSEFILRNLQLKRLTSRLGRGVRSQSQARNEGKSVDLGHCTHNSYSRSCLFSLKFGRPSGN